MTEIKRTLLEFLVVAVASLAVGLFQNGISKAGISLSRDYFPKGAAVSEPASETQPAVQSSSSVIPPVVPPAATIPAEVSLPSDNPLPPEEQVVLDAGLRIIHFDELARIYASQEYREGLYTIVDARTDDHYQSGHIPGACHLDHYRLERSIDQVLPACQGALKVVVYCNGGDCEDSRFTALDLIERGVAREILFVYVGGFTEWKAKNMPIETAPLASMGGK